MVEVVVVSALYAYSTPDSSSQAPPDIARALATKRIVVPSLDISLSLGVPRVVSPRCPCEVMLELLSFGLS